MKARKLSYADDTFCKVTLRHLLSHTAGIVDEEAFDTVVNRELIEPLKLSNTFLGTLDNFDRLFLL